MSGWQNEPFRVKVKKGETKVFCMCGQTKNAPFCDDSHLGVGCTPHAETFKRNKTIFICGCQQSGKRPFCDGSHSCIRD